MNPKISVLMAVFNAGALLQDAIESILSQTFSDFEFIIVNDASTDNSLGIIKSFNDDRIILIDNKENLGLTKNLNIALNIAKGEYIARMDADDISEPQRFEKQLKFLRDNPRVDIINSEAYIIDEEGNITGEVHQPSTDEEIKLALKVNNAFTPHGTIMAKKTVLDAVNGYDEEILRAQDYDLFLRLSDADYVFGRVPEILYRFRQHESAVTKKFQKQTFNDLIKTKALQRLPHYQNKFEILDKDIAIYILFLEKIGQTIECLKSFLPSGLKIYILNNGSSPESIKRLHEFTDKYDQITIFNSVSNLGVGVGRNLMIEKCTEKWLFFVDNDITVKTENWLEIVKNAILFDDKIEAFIPQLYNVHNNTYDVYTRFVIRDHTVDTAPLVYNLTNRFPGGASIINRKVFDRLGLYDNKMFVGFEDFELAIRGVIEGKEIKARVLDSVELVHKHVFSKADKDKEYIRTRYSINHLENSYNRIVEKHGLYLNDSYKTWAKNKIDEYASTITQRYIRRLRLFIEKCKLKIKKLLRRSYVYLKKYFS